MEFTVRRRGVNLKAVSRNAPAKFRRFVTETVGYFAYDTMVKRAPYKTGKLRSSVRRVVKGWEVTVKPTVDYAVYVEKGTAPHIIEPVNAQVLRFVVGGQVVFARHVAHPGTKPKPFVRETTEEVRRMLPIMFKQLGAEIWSNA